MGMKDYADTQYPNGVDNLTISIQVGDDTVPDNKKHPRMMFEQAYSR